jgi:hypothetical protein
LALPSIYFSKKHSICFANSELHSKLAASQGMELEVTITVMK